jgi:hypothetical protein
MIQGGAWTDHAREICEGVGRGPVRPAREIERLIRDMERSEDS